MAQCARNGCFVATPSPRANFCSASCRWRAWEERRGRKRRHRRVRIRRWHVIDKGLLALEHLSVNALAIERDLRAGKSVAGVRLDKTVEVP